MDPYADSWEPARHNSTPATVTTWPGDHKATTSSGHACVRVLCISMGPQWPGCQKPGPPRLGSQEVNCRTRWPWLTQRAGWGPPTVPSCEELQLQRGFGEAETPAQQQDPPSTGGSHPPAPRMGGHSSSVGDSAVARVAHAQELWAPRPPALLTQLRPTVSALGQGHHTFLPEPKAPQNQPQIARKPRPPPHEAFLLHAAVCENGETGPPKHSDHNSSL
jgi:hypothetical protein